MSAAGFEEFAEAVAARSHSDGPGDAPRYDRVTVLGGGADARLLAALCLAEGASVTLFSAYGDELAALASGVALRGAGPVGSYQVDQERLPSIKTTAEIDSAVADAQVIFLTGPIHKQRTYAMVLADHLRDGQVLVLAPGRSLGALETAWLLRVGGVRADITLVETQGLPYWFEAAGSTLNLSPAATVSAATLPSGRNAVLAGLSRYLPNLAPALSTVHSGFADGSGLVEVPALLLGGPAVGDGGPDIPMGGVPLPENQSFRALIGPEHEAVISKLAAERADVGRVFGVRNLPSASDWIAIHAGAASGEGSRRVPTRAQSAAILRDATIGSLVPLASAARIAGVSVPVTDGMITLVSSILGADIASAGRKLETVGIDATNIEQARRIMDDIAQGTTGPGGAR
jgi:opine dehydrogenase